MSRLPPLGCTAFLLFRPIRIRKQKKNISPPLEHVPIASRNYVHQKRKDGSKKREHEAKETIGAYREIEVIWYHGLLSDKRARQAERADKKASERRRTGI